MSKKLFEIRSANQCLVDAQELGTPEDLFHSLVYEGELTILFADTGVGKSILAMQIGNHIAKQGDTVLYADLELSDKQYEMRYSTNGRLTREISDNLLRLTFSPQSVEIPKGKQYDEVLIESLDEAIRETKSSVLIIDNMSAICLGDTDKANISKPLMTELKRLKEKYSLTLIIVDHTKKRSEFMPISINDLQGSKMKPNFADSVFYIGKSCLEENLRYIEQLKCRSTEVLYHQNNVLECEIIKENDFLQFKFGNCSTESKHLRKIDKAERNREIIQLKDTGLSNIEIASTFGLSEGAIRKIVTKTMSEELSD